MLFLGNIYDRIVSYNMDNFVFFQVSIMDEQHFLLSFFLIIFCR